MPNPATLQVQEEQQTPTVAPINAMDPAKKKAIINAILFAYMQILDSVHTGLMSTKTSADELNACESNMSRANNQEMNIDFEAVNDKGFVQKQGNWEIMVMDGHVAKAINGDGNTTVAASQLPTSILNISGMQKIGSMKFGNMMSMAIYQGQAIMKKATLNDFDKLQEDDQQIQKNRDFFANKIIIFQQSGQVQQTNIGSKNDFIAQFIQEDTNIATIMSTLSNELAQLLKTP